MSEHLSNQQLITEGRRPDKEAGKTRADEAGETSTTFIYAILFGVVIVVAILTAATLQASSSAMGPG